MGFLSKIISLLCKREDPAESGALALLHDLEGKGLSHEEAKETVTYMFLKESQKLKNKKAVEKKAQDNGGINDEDIKSVDNDWLKRFFGITEDISDEKMQDLWAHILAGEAKKPKSFSMRTLDSLRLLSSEEAKLFADAVQYVCFDSLLIVDTEFGISFIDQMVLADAQLILSEELTYTVKVKPNNQSPLKLDNKYILMLVNYSPNEIIVQFSIRKLTKVGRELLPLIERKVNYELYDYVASKIKKAGVKEIKLHKLLSSNHNGIISYVKQPEKEY